MKGCFVFRMLAMRAFIGLLFSLILTSMAWAQPEHVRTFIKENCLECHSDSDKSGGLDLSKLPWDLKNTESQNRWIKVFDRVEKGEMPPESKTEDSIRKPFSNALRTQLQNEIEGKQKKEGRTVMRRLNRREFENSLHELLGIDLPVQHLLPEEGGSHGFDTVADDLRISAVQLEKYLEVIDLALDDCLQLTERPTQFKKRLRYHDEKEVRENLDTAEDHVDPVSGQRHRRLFRELENAIVFISHGYAPDNLRQFAPPANGLYRIRASAYAVDAREDTVALRVYSSDWKSHRLLHHYDLINDKPRTVEFTLSMNTNEHLRFAGYGIGIDDQGKSVWNVDSVKEWKVPGMALEWVEIEGPLVDHWPPKRIEEVFGDDTVRELKSRGRWTPQGHLAYELAPENPKKSMAEAIQRFAERAFRRPLNEKECERFIQLANAELDGGRTYEQAMRVALRSILVSPRFLILDESPGRLDDFDLASRLSFALWSSPPDAELLQLAKEKKLTNRDIFRGQIDRLLKSPKSKQFVSSFVGQWLDLHHIDATTPDAKLYPEYDDILRDSMLSESEAFFQTIVDENLPVSQLIDSSFVTINRRLADHYGLYEAFAKANGDRNEEEFRRLELPEGSMRGGVMTQAAVLKVTANGTVTSPVLRGAWILRRILGTPPAPPPPVNAIEPDTRGASTIREQLAKHRESDTCNRCHREIDPPGFALESFDVIGGFRNRFRTVAGGEQPKAKLHGRDIWEYKLGREVDATGETSDGKRFEDIRDFKMLLLAQEVQVTRSLTEKLLTYFTGAGVSFADRPDVDKIVARSKEQGAGLRTLIHEVLCSETFRNK